MKMKSPSNKHSSHGRYTYITHLPEPVALVICYCLLLLAYWLHRSTHLYGWFAVTVGAPRTHTDWLDIPPTGRPSHWWLACRLLCPSVACCSAIQDFKPFRVDATFRDAVLDGTILCGITLPHYPLPVPVPHNHTEPHTPLVDGYMPFPDTTLLGSHTFYYRYALHSYTFILVVPYPHSPAPTFGHTTPHTAYTRTLSFPSHIHTHTTHTHTLHTAHATPATTTLTHTPHTLVGCWTYTGSHCPTHTLGHTVHLTHIHTTSTLTFTGYVSFPTR